MKRVFLQFTLILLLINGYCYSQSGWFWQNPKPVGSHIKDCFFVDNNTGYACGDDGSIIKTTNSGFNWIQLNAGPSKFLTSVFFINQFTGYVTSGNTSFPTVSSILKTTNEGISWNEIFSSGSHISSVVFYNENVGYAVGGNYWMGSKIFKTTNAGINWNQSPVIPIGFMNSIYFTSIDTTYIAGDGGIIMKTTNQGVNWIQLDTGPNNYTIYNSLYFTTSETGYAAGSGGRIYKTTNAGLNWSLLNSGTNGGFAEITFANANTGFACGWGIIVRTTNSGNNWDSLTILSTENLTTIKSINSNTVISCGYNGTIIKSTNNGNSWSFMSNKITSLTLNSSYIFDSVNYIISCDSSKIIRTFDGGNTWGFSELGGNYQLKSVTFVNQNTGFTSGGYSIVAGTTAVYYAKIFKTTNSGLNWFLVYGLNSERNIMYDIKFLNQMTGFSVGGTGSFPSSNSVILKTTNSGLNWVAKYNGGNSGIYSIFMVDTLLGFSCGEGGRILRTVNGGESWSLLNSGTNIKLNSIIFPSNNTGFACGGSAIMKTTNGGDNWFSTNLNFTYSFDIKSMYFVNSNTGIAVGISFPDYGRSGDIITTTNGGNNWIHLSSFASYPTYVYRGLNSIKFLNKWGILVGEKGTIIKTSNGGNIIGIGDVTQIIPYSFSLSQNYPNPFNPQTKIKFDVPKASFTKLVVYDLLGREIATLVNEELKPGTYEADWDASNFPSGVYFYKIISGEFVETKKMVLIK